MIEYIIVGFILACLSVIYTCHGNRIEDVTEWFDYGLIFIVILIFYPVIGLLYIFYLFLKLLIKLSKIIYRSK